MNRYLLLILLFVGSYVHAGVVYSAEQNIMGKPSTLRVWATSTKAKFVVESGNGAGIEIIATDSGKIISIVSAAQHMYLQMTRAQFLEVKAAQAAKQHVSFEDGKREELVLNQPGGKVAGIETRYYKLRITARTKEGTKEEDFQAIEEFWTAPSVPNIIPDLAMLTNQVSGIPGLDKLLTYDKFQGLPLKRLVTLSINGSPVGTSSVEVKAVTQAAIPDAVFEIPAGYTRKPIPGQSPDAKPAEPKE